MKENLTKRSPKVTSLKIAPELLRAAKIKAATEGTTLQSIVASALQSYLRKGGDHAAN